ncbi:MAG: LysM peptidoglycan-binding domain-containing protein [Nitriliruptorales bacterium]|nr:LysM peptidoglycan-binding domain-containing protein [Nitriliruptorales bacterium]
MRRRVLTVSMVGVFVLAGCGDGDPADTETDPTETATTTTAPTEEPSPETPDDAAPETYRVREGDTLSEIAERFGTTVRDLSQLNDIDDPHAIRVGQRLKIPAGD